MGKIFSKNIKHCRRCITGIVVPGTRYCEHCATHRKCPTCGEQKHISEFKHLVKNSSGQCEKCEDLTNNYKRCFHCKTQKHKSEFALPTDAVCITCKTETAKELHEKYGYRKCTICKEIKDVSEFDYLMKTCKTCARGRKSPIEKKKMSEIHCGYCDKLTKNKSRICNDCKDTKACRICKKRKKKNYFENESICKDCFGSKEHEEYNKKVYSGRAAPNPSNLQRNFYELVKQKFPSAILEHPFDFYHIDIAFIEYKIAIEVDGDYWHGNPLFYPKLRLRQIRRQKHDKRKQKYLERNGWLVYRFWENDILKDAQSCINQIKV